MPAINRYPHVLERNAQICARYDASRAEKLSLQDIGAEFGVCRETVRNVIEKRNRARQRAVSLEPLRQLFARGASEGPAAD
jgi:hypothetical protein